LPVSVGDGHVGGVTANGNAKNIDAAPTAVINANRGVLRFQ
jgi:hypothetical protein